MTNEEKMDQAIHRAYDQVTPEMGYSIMEELVLAAAEFWKRAEMPEDFCIQSVGGFGSIVFGGYNRVIWSLRYGFRMSESHCSEKFIKANCNLPLI